MAERYEGGCQCGSVRYVATGRPMNTRICHCRICQKVTGSPFFARTMFRRGDVEVTGPVSWFATSPDLSRGFCPRCGSTVFAERPEMDGLSIAVGTFDDPALFRPQHHVWTSSKQPWLTLDDGLPQYPEGPPPA